VKRSTGLPTIIVMCRPCRDNGKHSNLAEFDLGPDGPSQGPHTLGRWTGAEPDDRVHLRCRRCGHAPRPLPRRWILDALDTVTGKSVVYL
jgi:hypothetical protein